MFKGTVQNSETRSCCCSRLNDGIHLHSDDARVQCCAASGSHSRHVKSCGLLPCYLVPFCDIFSAIDATLAARGKDFSQPFVFGVLTYGFAIWPLTL